METKESGGPQFLAKIEKGKTTREYAPKKAIYRQGDPGDGIFYIEKGKVKIGVVSDRKKEKEAAVAILGPGDFLGESCLGGKTHRTHSATPLSECKLIRIERDAAIHALKKHSEFSEAFMAYLLTRNIRIQEDLVDQLFNSSEKRLARILLLLANRGKESEAEVLIPKISQETLAEMIGTTRSRVSFFMNKFRKLGFIRYDGGVHVRGSLLNTVLGD